MNASEFIHQVGTGVNARKSEQEVPIKKSDLHIQSEKIKNAEAKRRMRVEKTRYQPMHIGYEMKEETQ